MSRDEKRAKGTTRPSPLRLLKQVAQPLLSSRDGLAIVVHLLAMRPAQPVAKLDSGVAKLLTFGLKALEVPL
jgi:hypothetical protein